MVAYKLDHALGGKASTQRRITAKHPSEIPTTTKKRANTLSATNVPERGAKAPIAATLPG
jgi:hypothetical protein